MTLPSFLLVSPVVLLVFLNLNVENLNVESLNDVSCVPKMQHVVVLLLHWPFLRWVQYPLYGVQGHLQFLQWERWDMFQIPVDVCVALLRRHGCYQQYDPNQNVLLSSSHIVTLLAFGHMVVYSMFAILGWSILLLDVCVPLIQSFE